MEIPMKTSRYISTSATLLLLALGATTARADTGYAYALIIDNGSPSSPQVSAGNTLNPFTGGPVTVTRTSTGYYYVTFPNSGIGTVWEFEAAAWGATGGYCNVLTTDSGSLENLVTVQCYNSSGAGANSSFTVLAVSNQNDKNIAFAWADQATATSVYTANPTWS